MYCGTKNQKTIEPIEINYKKYHNTQANILRPAVHGTNLFTDVLEFISKSTNTSQTFNQKYYLRNIMNFYNCCVLNKKE